MATNLQPRQGMLALMQMAAIGLVPLVFGMMVVTWHLDRQLEKSARKAVKHTLLAVDRLLDQMQIATLEAVPTVAKPSREIPASLQQALAHEQGLQDLADGNMIVQVELKGMATWTQGPSRDRQQPSPVEFIHRAYSSKHPYAVQAGYTADHIARQARQSMLQVLPSLALVSLLTGATGYLGMARPRRLGAAQGAA